MMAYSEGGMWGGGVGVVWKHTMLNGVWRLLTASSVSSCYGHEQ